MKHRTPKWCAAIALLFAVLAACEHPSGPQAVLHPQPADRIDAVAERLGVQRSAELASARITLDRLVSMWSGPDRYRLDEPARELTSALRTLTRMQAGAVAGEGFEELSARARRLDAEESVGGQVRGKP